MSDLFVGTSGWSYNHWKGVFYPKDMSSKDFLLYYVTQFSTVELNASFYRRPSVETVKGWFKHTPEDFFFCPKLSRYITHDKKLQDAEAALKEFFRRFKFLKHKLGPILVQLPPVLGFHPERVNDFFTLLKKHYKRYRFAVEARHPDWTSPEALEFLAEYGMTWVIADSGKQYPFSKAILNDDVYLRFHGRKLYSSSYTRPELRPYVRLAEKALADGKRVWAFFNNDYRGYAIANALMFRDMLVK